MGVEIERKFLVREDFHPDTAGTPIAQGYLSRDPARTVRVRIAGFDRVLGVTQLLTKRVGAPVAAKAYEDRTPPRPPREFYAPIVTRDRGAGRPTKRERREIDRLHGRG